MATRFPGKLDAGGRRRTDGIARLSQRARDRPAGVLCRQRDGSHRRSIARLRRPDADRSLSRRRPAARASLRHAAPSARRVSLPWRPTHRGSTPSSSPRSSARGNPATKRSCRVTAVGSSRWPRSILRSAFVREAQSLLSQTNASMRALVERLRARFVTVDASYFTNVNTPEDLRRLGEDRALSLERSISAFARAKRVIAGRREFARARVQGRRLSPVFMKSGSGATLHDLDDNEYVDFVLSWGPLILGHAHPAVVKAIAAAAVRGTSFGTPTEAESELAELIVSMVPAIERLRFVSSGTEATMSAIRLGARIHPPPEDRQVCGRLPRSRRRLFDRGRFGRARPTAFRIHRA